MLLTAMIWFSGYVGKTMHCSSIRYLSTTFVDLPLQFPSPLYTKQLYLPLTALQPENSPSMVICFSLFIQWVGFVSPKLAWVWLVNVRGTHQRNSSELLDPVSRNRLWMGRGGRGYVTRYGERWHDDHSWYSLGTAGQTYQRNRYAAPASERRTK